MNVTSNICLKFYQEHVIEKTKVLLFESAKKTRSPNPVFLEHWNECICVSGCKHTRYDRMYDVPM